MSLKVRKRVPNCGPKAENRHKTGLKYFYLKILGGSDPPKSLEEGKEKMSLRSLILVCVGVVLVQAVVVADTIKEGKYFKAVCHFDDERMAEAVLETVESIWPVAAKVYGLSKKPLKKRLEVHLYNEVKDYEAADEELTGGEFKRNWAFASFGEKSAHVVLQPLYMKSLIPEIGLPIQTRHLLVHEAAHIVRYHACPNYRSQPRWFADGAADYIGFSTLIQNGAIPGLTEDPYTSTRMVRTLKLLESGELPTVSDILLGKIDALGFSDKYAVHMLLFYFMMEKENQKKFKKVMAEIRKMGGGENFDERLFKFIEKTFGKRGVGKLDKKFAAYIRSLSPVWEEVHGSLSTEGTAWLQLPDSDKNAIAYRKERKLKKDAVIKGAMKVLPSQHDQMNILLGRNETGFISLAFGPSFGLTVWDFDSKRKESWKKLHNYELNDFDVNEKATFQIHLKKDKVIVEFKDQNPIEVSLNGRSTRGYWGLGVQKKSAGIWYDVKQTELDG